MLSIFLAEARIDSCRVSW